MTLSLLRRPNGSLFPLTKSLLHPGMLPTVVRQKSTLSAINEAIRKARKHLPPHDPRRQVPGKDDKPKRENKTYRERQEAREALREAKPAFKIRKGHKTITVDAAKAQPASRQKRFYDEENTFAKKSLVYQLKTGKLREELKQIGEEEKSSEKSSTWSKDSASSSRGEGNWRDRPERSETHLQNSSSFREFEEFGNRGAEKSGFRDRRRLERGSRSRFGDRGRPERRSAWDSSRSSENSDPFQRSDRYGGRSGEVEGYRQREDRPREDRPWEDRNRDDDRPPRDYHDREERSYPRRTSFRTQRDSDGPPPPHNAPISIPYTTAASQFLYGRSVVLAALNSSRRKLYKLYIYGGSGRQKIENDEAIYKKARKKGIPVEIVGLEGAGLLDKMSGSRPHNGYVLEASPLPQLPVTGLGPYTDASKDPEHLYKSGFEISLGHQSAEEAAVNGTSPFVVTTKSTRKPLVVVLDQVQDPGNLGAILRTVSFLGVSAVAITKRASAAITPVALKSSAGAAESITLFSIANSVQEFLENSRTIGEWQVYAATPESSSSKRRPQVNTYEVEDMDPLRTKPCILVLGSEGEGLSSQIMSKADYQISIPNLGVASHGGEVDSLNVSVAAGLLTSAFMRGAMLEFGKLVAAGAKGDALF